MAVNELSKATGRRKTAVAHVRLVSGTGKWTVNGVEVERYIPSESLRDYINQPFVMTETAGKYDVLVSAKGGGIAGRRSGTGGRRAAGGFVCQFGHGFSGAKRSYGKKCTALYGTDGPASQAAAGTGL